jgi:hypothetical protein
VSSLLSLARTLFLVLLLAAGAAALSLDSRRLVLRPVERMVDRVREMAEDPLRQARGWGWGVWQELRAVLQGAQPLGMHRLITGAVLHFPLQLPRPT